MGFLDLQQEPGVYSRVTAGMDVRNCTWFSEVRIPAYLRRTPQEASGGEAGDRVSLSIWHSDVGTPIHFQEESGIVTL